MSVYIYAIMTYALTAVISLILVGLIVVINKIMSVKPTAESDKG